MSQTRVINIFIFFFQAEDGIRDRFTWLEFRRVLFRSPRVIQTDLTYCSHTHLNYEVKTPELSNCNCSWSDFSSLLYWSEWWRIRTTLFIVQLQECENRIRESDSTCGLTEEPPNWRMTGWGIWLRILEWLEMVERSSVAKGNLNLLQSQIVEKINRRNNFCVYAKMFWQWQGFHNDKH